MHFHFQAPTEDLDETVTQFTNKYSFYSCILTSIQHFWTCFFVVSEWNSVCTSWGKAKCWTRKQGKILQSAKKKMPLVVSLNVLSRAELSLLRLSSVVAHVSSSQSRVCYEDSSSHWFRHCSCKAKLESRESKEVWGEDEMCLSLHIYKQKHFECFCAAAAAVVLKELSDTALLMGPTLYLQLVTPLGNMGNCMNWTTAAERYSVHPRHLSVNHNSYWSKYPLTGFPLLVL